MMIGLFNMTVVRSAVMLADEEASALFVVPGKK